MMYTQCLVCKREGLPVFPGMIWHPVSHVTPKHEPCTETTWGGDTSATATGLAYAYRNWEREDVWDLDAPGKDYVWPK